MNSIGEQQGCRMVSFQTKNPNLGKFWRVLLWKLLLYFMTIWPILQPLEIFYGHLRYFVAFWYIFPRFGILDQEKSGNPGEQHRLSLEQTQYVQVLASVVPDLNVSASFRFLVTRCFFRLFEPGLPDGLSSNQKSQFG
jgi:hypothetical protein